MDEVDRDFGVFERVFGLAEVKQVTAPPRDMGTVFAARGLTRQGDYVVGGAESLKEGSADEAARAGDDDARAARG